MSGVYLYLDKEIGAQSIIYVCTNQFLLAILERVPLPIKTTFWGFLWKVTELIIIVTICFIGNRILQKTPLRIILGEVIVSNCIKKQS